jgi:predicted TIM-barrel fold metal-dependent hydrolase
MRAIDLAINVEMSRLGRPAWLEKAGEIFQQGEAFHSDIAPDELIALMDEHGVEKAVLGVDPLDPSPHVLSFSKRHPGRFFLAAGVDPRGGMKMLRGLHDFARAHEHVLVEVRVTPFAIDLAPTAPVYYPLYARCIDLGLPIGILSGIPVPPVPSECQDPMHIDRVCLDFPELVVILCHGADPWWDVALRLLLKYPNLYLQTSAWAPKRLPQSLLQFMNKRAPHKVMWASNHPSLPLARCMDELPQLDLRPEVLDAFVYGNAERVLFSARAR